MYIHIAYSIYTIYIIIQTLVHQPTKLGNSHHKFPPPVRTSVHTHTHSTTHLSASGGEGGSILSRQRERRRYLETAPWRRGGGGGGREG